MESLITFVQVMIGLGAIPAIYRLVIGPDLADRAVALDVVLLLLASAIAANGARDGEQLFTPLLIVVALVAFLATATLARYAEWRKGES